VSASFSASPAKSPAGIVEIAVNGRDLLDNPLLNKGSAFTEDERRELGLLGLLPPHVSTAEEQLARTYENYRRKPNDLERYIFLVSLQDRNETLFYMLLARHITEMMPVIYTPVVGEGCRHYSHIYRRPRGLYISWPHVDDIDRMLGNAPCPDPAVIVVTDGERILGLGDLGVGGMGIPVGKLSLYTLCAGIHPAATLPIVLDVGTNNQDLLDDPLYLGWRHPRIAGADYDRFVEAFVTAVIRRFPGALLQWEDFSKHNAARLLARYRDRLCTFNDDIQGTGAVTLAGLLTAMRATGGRLRDQRIVILGAGSSAIGISDQVVAAMLSEGLSDADARAAIWLVDSEGLVHGDRANLSAAKRPYAQPRARVADWTLADRADRIGLLDVIRHVRPAMLIGASAQPGAFTEEAVRAMAAGTARPIIFPLSNPTSKSEAAPADLLQWTDGRALVATGSPFPDVVYGGTPTRIGQCNNAFVFPGVGLGVIASGAMRLSDAMFVAAARALSAESSADAVSRDGLYPRLERARDIAQHVAMAVGTEAQRSGVAPALGSRALEELVRRTMWTPAYPELRHTR
jgi:malate dehydrogenase (oxaloacetate-decarboxylating)